MRDIQQQETLFPKLMQEEMDFFARHGQEVHLNSDDVLFREGEPARNFFVILEGEVRVTRRAGGEDTLLTIHGPGDFTGELSLLSDGAFAIATARALTPCRVVQIPANELMGILTQCPRVSDTILTAMARRMKDAEALLQQREKMAALGKLAAGLAHELNNPAAAANRAAQQLGDALKLRDHIVEFSTDENDWLSNCIKKTTNTQTLNSLERSDREEDIANWLEDHSISEGWQIAGSLTEIGLDLNQLDTISERITNDRLQDCMGWLAATWKIDSLVREIEQSTQRISELVKAVKIYSYMDQAPVQEVDVQKDIESTLLILGYKLKAGVTVIRDYDPDLPCIYGFGSELNQVWTNILDNAIDAMSGHGVIHITTRAEKYGILVEITDNGTGIAPKNQSRIFEPFFTTKDVGEGTGLGLDTAYRIVVQRHGGDIGVTSHPGETRFSVRLPKDLTMRIPSNRK